MEKPYGPAEARPRYVSCYTSVLMGGDRLAVTVIGARGEHSKSLMKKNIEIVPNIQKLFGIRDENLQMMESGLNVNIELKSDSLQIEGAARDVARAEQIFTD